MFGFRKKKEDNLDQIQQIQTPEPVTFNQQDVMKQDIMNDIFSQKKGDMLGLPESPALDFETIEVKTRPSIQSAMQLATFADLSALSRRTPIFVFRDKKANTYFGLVEGKMFYLKK